jgi:hypothetical protein
MKIIDYTLFYNISFLSPFPSGVSFLPAEGAREDKRLLGR